jgi:tetratricopeptide (TPR) repeat protein
VGKTTLALRAAHLLHDRFPDGRLYAKLGDGEEPTASTHGVLDRFLRAFGVRPSELPEGLAERAEMYRSLLAGRRLLVVLDDATSVGQIDPLLPGDPRCAVIITCRTRLARPAGAACLEVGVLDATAGAALLTQVIGADRTRAEPEAITALVEFCAGLPLALRIASAKLAARPHWRIERLTDRLANERRRLDELALEGSSIRATFDFTYQNLTGKQQQLLRRLSLLGPRDFPYWVGAPLLDADVIEAEELLEELVVTGLVEAWSTPGGETRYQLHDLVRLYAEEALADADTGTERQAMLTRYLGCWLSLTTEAHRRHYGGDFYVLHGSGQRWPLSRETTRVLLADPIAWLQAERALVVAAILLAAHAAFDELCWDLAMTSVTLFESGPYSEDWRETHVAALAATREAGNQRGTAALLLSLGMLATTRQLDEAADLLRQSCQLWEQLGDWHGMALARHGLAGIERLRGSYDGATAQYEMALKFFEQSGDHAGQAAALRCLGQIEMDRQHYVAAEDLFKTAISVAEQAESRRDRTQARYHLAELWLQCGDLKRAEQLFQAVYAETRTEADTIGQGYGLLGLGITYTRAGDPGRAVDNLRTALAVAERTDDMLLRGRVLLAGAELDNAENRSGSALAQLDKALAAFADLGSATVWQARGLELVGRVHQRRGDTAEAVRSWRSAAELVGAVDSVLAARLVEHLRQHDKPADPAA